MDETLYSHDDVWLLLRSLPHMRYAKEADLPVWKAFVTAVCDETANGYSPHWNTEFTINKMANDIGSYKLLTNMWLHVEDALNNLDDPFDQ